MFTNWRALIILVSLFGAVTFISIGAYRYIPGLKYVAVPVHERDPKPTVTPAPTKPPKSSCSIPGVTSGFTQRIADTFTRRNEYAQLGKTETGHAWVPISGTWGVFNNHMYCSDLPCKQSYALVDVGKPNATISLKASLGGYGHDELSIPFRVVDDANMYWLQSVATQSGMYTLNKKVRGVKTVLAKGYPQRSFLRLTDPRGPLYDPIQWERIAIKLSGENIEIIVNDSPLFQVTDCSVKGVKHGVGGERLTGINSVFDDFTIDY